MISKFLILNAVTLALPIAAMSQQQNPTNLETYEWKNRLVLIFSPPSAYPNYQQQMAEWQNLEAGFDDRDIKIFHLLGEGKSFIDEQKISSKEVSRLSKKYEVDDAEFTVILIGKDGTEKLRGEDPLRSQKLFSVIDAMPMRQREMQEN